VTVSAARHAPASLSSATDETRKVFRNELTACLALVAPVGMTEENRRDWLAVAWQTLKDIPPDILAAGAKKARLRCDHPSKIVPAIVEETAEAMRWRREGNRYSYTALPAPAPQPYCSPEDAARILAEFGLKRDPEAPLT
jgi:hypothetical protein